MVSKAYMLDKPAGPSKPKLFFDQTIVPMLIDSAGSIEGVLERFAVHARRRPIVALGAGFGLGTMAALLTVPHRPWLTEMAR